MNIIEHAQSQQLASFVEATTDGLFEESGTGVETQQPVMAGLIANIRSRWQGYLVTARNSRTLSMGELVKKV